MEAYRRCTRALMALALALPVGLAAASSPAGAADLDDLRTEAQDVASSISDLERRFADLHDRRDRIEAEIDSASLELARLEAEIAETDAAHQVALDSYVERAIEAYKTGPSGGFELLLSARDLDDVFMLTKAGSRLQELDAEALDRLLEARRAAEEAQRTVDERKQALLTAQARAELVTARIGDTLDARRSLLVDLEAEIAHLEAEARRLAALTPNPTAAFKNLIDGTGPSRGIPEGFVGTGIVIQGTASWYGPGFQGNPTASGAIFDTNQYTAASKELPLNSWLYVEHEGRGVVVLVNDRGPYHDDWILDLSNAAANAIGIVSSGTGWVEAEVLLKVKG